jgi:fibronectin-binding autotransporter adhesin
MTRPVRSLSRSLRRAPVVATALRKFLLVMPAIGLSMAGTAQAATQLTWSGTSSTAWATGGAGGNWSNSAAPASSLTTNTALFNSLAYTNQPNTGTTIIGGLEIGASSTGSTLNISGTQLTLGNALTGSNGILKDALSGAATISVGTIKLGQATNNWKNNSSTLLTISSAISSSVAGSNTITINGTGTGGIKFTGVISDGTGTTAMAISTGGSGLNVTTLSGANTFTGGLQIVDFSGSSVAFTGSLSVSSGAVTATALGEGAVSLGLGTSTLNYTTGSGGFINNAITLSNGGSIILGNSSGNTVNYSAGITGSVSSFSFTVGGSSSTIFSGANTYTGPTIVTGDLTLAGSNTGGGTFSVTGGNMNLTGTITGSNISTSGAGIFTESSAGVIAGTGATFTQGSSGTSTLAGANTYTGTTTVTAGTLKAGIISVANVSGAFGDNSAVTMSGGTLDIAGFNTQIGSLTGSSGTVTNSGSAATLTVGGDNTSPAAYSSTITNGANSLALTKIGSGTLTLSGSNSYTGPTTISSGATFITNTSGSALGTGSLTVAAGATFGGSGTGSLTSYTIGAASSPVTTVQVGSGNDTTSKLTLIGSTASNITNANLQFNLSTSGTGNQLSVGATALTLSGDTLTLNITNLGVIGNNTPYILIAGTGGTGTGLGQYSGFSVDANGVISGLSLTITGVGAPAGWYNNSFLELVNTAGGVDDIEVVFVPEPSTWAMMMGGLATLVFILRRKRREMESSDSRR